MVTRLARRHQVVVAAFAQLSDEGPLDHLAELPASVTVHVVELDDEEPHADGRLPREIFRYDRPGMRQLVAEVEATGIDVVIAEHVFMAEYALAFGPAVKVIHEHNVESEVLTSAAALLKAGPALWEPATLASRTFAGALTEGGRMLSYETSVWPRFDLRVAVTADDRAVIDQRCPGRRTIVVPNGAAIDDIPYLQLAPSRTMLFMGTLDYYPNVDAVHHLVEDVMPLLPDDIVLCVAGRNPSAGIRELGRSDRVRVVPFPKTMNRLAAASRMIVLPLRIGGGSRLRIPHAFALGRPVVSTTLGCVGYDVSHSEHLMVADSAVDFADAVNRLVDDDQLALHLRGNARRLAEREHRWDAGFDRLTAELEALVSARLQAS